MNREYKYLQDLIFHENWHILRNGEPLEDLSCIECHPIEILKVSDQFCEFWKYWAIPRCIGSTFTVKTVEFFEQLRNCIEEQQVLELITQLIRSIIYPQIPNFEQLIDSLQFYWEITDQLENWDTYNSDYTSEISEMGSSNKVSMFGGDDFDVDQLNWNSNRRDREYRSTVDTVRDEDEDNYSTMQVDEKS